MRKLLLIAMVFLVVSSTFILTIPTINAEATPPPVEWDKTYGGATSIEGAWSLVQTRDGGYALAGARTLTVVGHWWDVWFVKADSSGNMQSSNAYGGSHHDGAYSLVQTADGGFAMAGWTESFGAGMADSWLVKTDASGNMLWSQTYGGIGYDLAYSLIQTSDGGYVMAGATSPSGAQEPYDFWLVKTDSSGNLQWSQAYGGTGDDQAWSVVQTSDGGYAIAGYTNSYGSGSSDFWLIKTDSSGNMQWNQTYGGVNGEWAQSMILTDDGGYALAGWTESFGAGNRDFWLVKTDLNGNMQWSQWYGGTNQDEAYSLVQTADGGYALAGWTYSFGNGDRDAWLVRTDADGYNLWDQTYGGTGNDGTLSLIRTSDGGYALGGYTWSFGAGYGDFWLIKLAPEIIFATVDIDPDTLNLRSKGTWITAYIELPEGYDVNDINISSILLNDTISVDPAAPTAIGDYDNDTIPDLMVKFDRAKVISYILDNIDIEERFKTVTLTVTGYLYDGTPFQGSDTIRVIVPPNPIRWLHIYFRT